MTCARQLAGLRVQIDAEQLGDHSFGEVLRLAERYQLSTYDAAYLELAQRYALPIATSDSNIMQVAAAVKVAVFKP